MPSPAFLIAQARLPYQVPFTLYPPAWRSFPGAALKWTTVPFKSSALGTVDETRGVYAFVLDPRRWSSPLLPLAAYVLYIGEVGEDNDRTLRDRMRDYLEKRPHSQKVETMMELFRDYLFFSFAEVNAKLSTRAVETMLCDALLPPYNDRDFSPEIRRSRRAFP